MKIEQITQEAKEVLKERFKEKNKEYIKGFFEIFFCSIIGAICLVNIVLFAQLISHLISETLYLQDITFEIPYYGFLLFISFFVVILIIYMIIEDIRDIWKEAKKEIENE